MFYIDNLYSCFLKKNIKLPIQTKYRVYVFFKQFKKDLTFKQFNIYLSFFLKFSVISVQPLVVFLCLFFFEKTSNLKNFNKIKYNFQRKGVNVYINSVTNFNWNLSKLSIFWVKWKKLIRPKPLDKNLTFFENFQKKWKNKLEIYQQLKFVKICDFYPCLLYVNLESFKKELVIINKSIFSTLSFSSSSTNKLIDIHQLQNFEFQFLRKNKVYNKGRYSRCRQNYRTGVYMCMYLSVVSIFGLYYWFFKFSFNFTYLWWLFIGFVGSFFIPKIIKYRLYEPSTLLNKFFDFFKWFYLIIKSIFY